MIIFSIIAHEQPKSIKDLCENIHYFTKIPHKIIINTNPAIFIETQNEIKNLNYTLIYPHPCYKKKHNSIIWKSHCNNFEYLIENKIDFSYFIMIASNCLMLNPIQFNNIEGSYTTGEKLKNWIHYKKLVNNEKLMDFFDENKIQIYLQQHEGIVFEKPILNKIIEFQKKNNVFNLITREFCIEEILPVSLYHFFTNKLPINICFLYRKCKKITEIQYNEIKDKNYIFVKRVDRNPDDLIRLKIRKDNRNYEDE